MIDFEQVRVHSLSIVSIDFSQFLSMVSLLICSLISFLSRMRSIDL